MGDRGFDGLVRDVEAERQNVSNVEGVVEELLRDTDVVELVKLGRAGPLQKQCAFREVLCAVLHCRNEFKREVDK